MGLIDQAWNATLWRMPTLRALPDEERVRVLKQTRGEARVAQHVLVGFLVACVAAFVAGVIAFGIFDVRFRIPYPVAILPWPIALALRSWRDRVVSRSVRRQLLAMRRHEVATILASHPHGLSPVAEA